VLDIWTDPYYNLSIRLDEPQVKRSIRLEVELNYSLSG
jgi:hypothetical protein